MRLIAIARRALGKARSNSRVLSIVGIVYVIFAVLLVYLGTSSLWLSILVGASAVMLMRMWFVAEKHALASAESLKAIDKLRLRIDDLGKRVNNLGHVTNQLSEENDGVRRSVRRLARSSKRLADPIAGLTLELAELTVELQGRLAQ